MKKSQLKRIIKEEISFILGPWPDGDPNKPFDKDFEIIFNAKNPNAGKFLKQIGKILFKNKIEVEHNNTMDASGKYKIIIKKPTAHVLDAIFDMLPPSGVVDAMGWYLGESISKPTNPLKQIIKEEIRKVLKEAFGDPIAQKLEKMGGLSSRWRSFWKTMSNQYDIAWDKLPKGSFRKIKSPNEAKKGMAFYVVNNEKPNPFANRRSYWGRTIPSGVLAVTLDGKIQYYHGRTEGITSKAAGVSTGDVVGQAPKGTAQVKKIAEIADEIYLFDLGAFRGGTKALKAARAELKLGKDIFKDDRAFKKANMERYRDLLAAKIGTKSHVDRIMAEIVKLTNEYITTGFQAGKKGKRYRGSIVVDINGKENQLSDIASNMQQALRTYERYIGYVNDVEQDKKDGYTSGYSKGAVKREALDLKEYLLKLKKGNVTW